MQPGATPSTPENSRPLEPNGPWDVRFHPTPVFRPEHEEGTLTRVIEQQTAKLPSDVWLFASFSSMALSLMLQASGRKSASIFVGQWAPTLLILGLYNKLVKVAGAH